MRLIVSAVLAGLSTAAAPAQTQPELLPEPEGFRLPPGFDAEVFAEDLGDLREMAVTADGVVYVIRKSRGWFEPGVLALADADGDGFAETREAFGGLVGSDVEVWTDLNGAEWVYAAGPRNVYRWRRAPGDLAPSGRRETIVRSLPRMREHAWKTLAIDPDGGLYVMFGAPSNVCETEWRSPSPGRTPCPELENAAGVWRFDAARRGQRQGDGEQFATGVRNMIAFEWDPLTGGLYGAQHGRDFLNRWFPDLFSARDGAELPSEEFHRIERGDDLGWPFSYFDHEAGERRTNPEYETEATPNRGRNPADPAFKMPLHGFPGHWAPSGLAFAPEGTMPEPFARGAFIAFKGGWGRNIHPPQEGYRISFLPLTQAGEKAGEPIIFADGFEGRRPLDYPSELPFPSSRNDGATAPQGLAFGPDGALFLGDARAGRIWRITWRGEAAAQAERRVFAGFQAALTPVLEEAARLGAAIAPPPSSLTLASMSTEERGEALYRRECAACHGVDGRGAEKVGPSLTESRRLAGERRPLLEYVFRGAAGSGWRAAMPAYRDGPLSDEELRAVLTYARAEFSGEGAVTVEDVEIVRRRVPRAGG